MPPINLKDIASSFETVFNFLKSTHSLFPPSSFSSSNTPGILLDESDLLIILESSLSLATSYTSGLL